MGASSVHRILLSICFALVLSSSSRASSDSPAQIWYDAHLVIAPGPDAPLNIEWTLKQEPLRTRAELTAELAKIEDFPNHPKRLAIQNQLAILDYGRALGYRFMYAGEHAWYFWFEMPIPGGMSLYAGGLEKTRWMLAAHPGGSQLTIIRSGKPFPRGSNVSRILDQARGHLATLLTAGIGLRHMAIVESDAGSDSWSALLGSGTEGDVVRLTGGWIDDARFPIVRVAETIRDGVVVSRIDYSAHEWVPDLGIAVPMRVDQLDSNGLANRYRVLSIGLVSRKEVEQYAQRPGEDRLSDLGVSPVILDFGDPDKATKEMFRDTPMLTWSLSD